MGLMLIAGLLAPPAANINEMHPGTSLCFGVAYSQEHMNKHPLQTVKALTVRVVKASEGPGSAVRLGVRANIRKGVYDTEMICDLEGHRLVCGVECDGGRATLRWNPHNPVGGITFINQSFAASGGCAHEKAEEIWVESRRGGDDVFRLKPMPEEICSLH